MEIATDESRDAVENESLQDYSGAIRVSAVPDASLKAMTFSWRVSLTNRRLHVHGVLHLLLQAVVVLLQEGVHDVAVERLDLLRRAADERHRVHDAVQTIVHRGEQRVLADSLRLTPRPRRHLQQVERLALLFIHARRLHRVHADRLVQLLAVAAAFTHSIRMFSVAMKGSCSFTCAPITFGHTISPLVTSSATVRMMSVARNASGSTMRRMALSSSVRSNHCRRASAPCPGARPIT